MNTFSSFASDLGRTVAQAKPCCWNSITPTHPRLPLLRWIGSLFMLCLT